MCLATTVSAHRVQTILTGGHVTSCTAHMHPFKRIQNSIGCPIWLKVYVSCGGGWCLLLLYRLPNSKVYVSQPCPGSRRAFLPHVYVVVVVVHGMH